MKKSWQAFLRDQPIQVEERSAEAVSREVRRSGIGTPNLWVGYIGELNMTESAKSVFIFGVYLICLAIVLVLAPNILLGLFGIEPTAEVWIRVLGMVVGVLGYYYIVAGRNGLGPFIRATVYGRPAVLISFIVFAILGLVKPILILFGMIDFLGAIWTALLLRSESR